MSDRLEEATGGGTKACKVDLVTECASGGNTKMNGDAFNEKNCMSGRLDEDHEASKKSCDTTEVVGTGEIDHMSSSLPETKGRVQNGTDEEVTNSTICELKEGNEDKCGVEESMVSSDLCGVGEKSDEKTEELVDSSPCPTQKELYENEPDLMSAVLDEKKPYASTVESELYESTAEPTNMNESDSNRQPIHEGNGDKMCHSKYEEETYGSDPHPATELEISKPFPPSEENLDDNTPCSTNERPDDQKPHPHDGELESVSHVTNESEMSELTSASMEVSSENMSCQTSDSKPHSCDNTSVPHPQNDDPGQPHPPNSDDSKLHPLNLGMCGDGSETIEQSTTAVSELATELSQTGDKSTTEPAANSSTTEPAVNFSTTELAANSSATEPAASPSATEPTASSSSTEPAASSSSTEPAASSSSTKPAASSSATKPATSSSSTEPAASSSATKPAASSSATEPAASSSATKPAASSSATKPAASSSATKPAASSSATNPAANPSKRLTRAEKAAQEALAAFGGSDFSSLSVRKVDLQEQLKKEAEIRKKNEKREETAQTSPTNRPQRRLQKAQTEVQQEFKDIALGEGLKKYPKVALAKQKALLKKVEGESTNPAVRYQTRLQKSKAYAKEAFGGASLDKLPLKPGRTLQSVHVTKAPGSVPVQNKTTAAPKRTLSRADKAKLESLQAFGGASLDKVMGSTRKRVARHFDDYPAKKKVKVSRRSEGTSGADGEGVAVEKENSDVEAAAV